MCNYYLLDRSSLPGRWIGKRGGTNEPLVDWYYWRKGLPIPETEKIPNPITFELKPFSQWASDNSQHMPAILKASVPLFRNDFIEALNSTGIKNLITYDCEILDPDTGKIYTDYKVINVVGMISVDGIGKLNASVPPNDLLLFRVAESNNGIFVHQSVKDRIESLGFNDVSFFKAKDVAL